MGKENCPHFDCHRNPFEQITEAKWCILNITWRMISRGYEGNIMLNTFSGAQDNGFYYSFVVFNFLIGLKHVYYSCDNKEWTLLTRDEDYNRWTVPDKLNFLPIFNLNL